MASLLGPIEGTPYVGGTANSFITVDVNGLQVTLTGIDGELLTWNSSGVPTTIAAGAEGTVLTGHGDGAEATFDAAAGGGNVSNTATPVNNQLAIWTDATTVEGDAGLTWDGNDLLLGAGKRIGIGVSPAVAFDIVTTKSSGGVMKLKNSAADGYSSFDIFDNTGTLVMQFGRGNASVAVPNLVSTAYMGTRTASNLILFAHNHITAPEITVGDYEVYFGNGFESATPVDGKIRGTSGVGTDITGGDLILAAGAPTGSGDPGHLLLQVAIADAGTGTTLNGLSTVIEIDANTTVALLGFHGVTPVAQPAGTGETTGFTAGSGTAVNDDSTFTGNVGATAYRINDVVKALKNLGLLAQ